LLISKLFKRRSLARSILLGCICSGLLIWPATLSAKPFTSFVCFGDSLSDTGNLAAVTFGLVPDPLEYYQGRFSNGPLWVEYLAQALMLEDQLDVRAYAGATSGRGRPPGLLSQVDAYLVLTKPSADALYSVWAGANDVFNDYQNATAGAENIGTALERLLLTGAQYFLVPNLPDIGLTPRYNSAATTAASYTMASQNFNAALQRELDDFASAYPMAIVYRLDTFDLFHQFLAEPARFGLINVTATSPNLGSGFSNTEGYLFWDEVHPTTEGHAIFANEIARLLEKPLLEVTVNNADQAITVSPDTTIEVALAVDPKYYGQRVVDWWLVLYTPQPPPGNWRSWTLNGQWIDGLQAIGQSVPLEVPAAVTVWQGFLEPGLHHVIFAFDDQPNGIADGNIITFDMVSVTVTN
jgi:phospholipase/lecithinase/hemolysin